MSNTPKTLRKEAQRLAAYTNHGDFLLDVIELCKERHAPSQFDPVMLQGVIGICRDLIAYRVSRLDEGGSERAT